MRRFGCYRKQSSRDRRAPKAPFMTRLGRGVRIAAVATMMSFARGNGIPSLLPSDGRDQAFTIAEAERNSPSAVRPGRLTPGRCLVSKLQQSR
jgi:hypothetical protein